MMLDTLMSDLLDLLAVLIVACGDVIAVGVLACLIYGLAQLILSWWRE